MLAEIENIRGHIAALEGVRHPLAAPAALERAASYIAGHLQLQGFQVSEQHFPEGGGFHRNVIGSLPGGTQQHRRILLMAHYDTVAASPGADDNASGVAVMLEVARLLTGRRFERTVQLVGVSLEENQTDQPGSGLLGSSALARLAHQEGWEIEGVVVLESVGFSGERIVQHSPAGLPVSVPPFGDFLAVIGNQHSADLVRAFVGQGLLPSVPLIVPGNGELLPDTRRSDHAPFWDLGYRAIMLTDTTNFRNPHYHGPGDTIDTLNLPFATRVCTATARLVADLAGTLPPTEKNPAPGSRAGS